MHVTFFLNFTWKIVNQVHFPFSELNLLPAIPHPKWTPLCKWGGILFYLTYPQIDISFSVDPIA